MGALVPTLAGHDGYVAALVGHWDQLLSASEDPAADSVGRGAVGTYISWPVESNYGPPANWTYLIKTLRKLHITLVT